MTEEQRRRWRDEGVFPVECWGQGPGATPLVCPLPDRELLRKLAEAVPAHIQTSGWYATAQRHNHKTVHASVYGDNFRGMGRQAIASVISVGDYSGPLADYIAAACPRTMLALLDRIAELEAAVAKFGSISNGGRPLDGRTWDGVPS
ncbi:ead/Ea22-like family protein [Pseudacidovorax sp. NFM-22]|uniref:ead/Ea22-like family protein n=1 Tax=Pseudacidovorax sp. NFM-22 TaxID=2744469 RepID=UPI001F3C7110|nr:ead/Ea22-like family protein [Pseudacidovorax sp. NFM-22]